MSVIAMIAAMALTGAAPVATEVSAPGPRGPLRGTLLAPAGAPRATVLILPGSGATDRDGDNRGAGLLAAPYRLLAEALAERGIASVRVDKRGLGGSASAGDGNAVTMADYARDTAAWLHEARARTGARCVWLLGHSEGGLVALAAREDPNVCGLILVASPGRPIGQALREQLRANPANAPILEAAFAAIERLEGGERIDEATLHPALRPLFPAVLQAYWIDLFSHDPAAMVAGYSRPVLIVSGSRDLQITEADARALAGANAGARLVILPGVNHVLKQVDSDDRAANVATYSNPNLPLAAGVAGTIADFVIGHPAR
jgi:pimeloyl-ACP methyl ester carboxylesterase